MSSILTLRHVASDVLRCCCMLKRATHPGSTGGGSTGSEQEPRPQVLLSFLDGALLEPLDSWMRALEDARERLVRWQRSTSKYMSARAQLAKAQQRHVPGRMPTRADRQRAVLIAQYEAEAQLLQQRLTWLCEQAGRLQQHMGAWMSNLAAAAATYPGMDLLEPPPVAAAAQEGLLTSFSTPSTRATATAAAAAAPVAPAQEQPSQQLLEPSHAALEEALTTSSPAFPTATQPTQALQAAAGAAIPPLAPQASVQAAGSRPTPQASQEASTTPAGASEKDLQEQTRRLGLGVVQRWAVAAAHEGPLQPPPAVCTYDEGEAEGSSSARWAAEATPSLSRSSSTPARMVLVDAPATLDTSIDARPSLQMLGAGTLPAVPLTAAPAGVTGDSAAASFDGSSTQQQEIIGPAEALLTSLEAAADEEERTAAAQGSPRPKPMPAAACSLGGHEHRLGPSPAPWSSSGARQGEGDGRDGFGSVTPVLAATGGAPAVEGGVGAEAVAASRAQAVQASWSQLPVEDSSSSDDLTARSAVLGHTSPRTPARAMAHKREGSAAGHSSSGSSSGGGDDVGMLDQGQQELCPVRSCPAFLAVHHSEGGATDEGATAAATTVELPTLDLTVDIPNVRSAPQTLDLGRGSTQGAGLWPDLGGDGMVTAQQAPQLHVPLGEEAGGGEQVPTVLAGQDSEAVKQQQQQQQQSVQGEQSVPQSPVHSSSGLSKHSSSSTSARKHMLPLQASAPQVAAEAPAVEAPLNPVYLPVGLPMDSQALSPLPGGPAAFAAAAGVAPPSPRSSHSSGSAVALAAAALERQHSNEPLPAHRLELEPQVSHMVRDSMSPHPSVSPVGSPLPHHHLHLHTLHTHKHPPHGGVLNNHTLHAVFPAAPAELADGASADLAVAQGSNGKAEDLSSVEPMQGVTQAAQRPGQEQHQMELPAMETHAPAVHEHAQTPSEAAQQEAAQRVHCDGTQQGLLAAAVAAEGGLPAVQPRTNANQEHAPAAQPSQGRDDVSAAAPASMVAEDLAVQAADGAQMPGRPDAAGNQSSMPAAQSTSARAPADQAMSSRQQETDEPAQAAAESSDSAQQPGVEPVQHARGAVETGVPAAGVAQHSPMHHHQHHKHHHSHLQEEAKELEEQDGGSEANPLAGVFQGMVREVTVAAQPQTVLPDPSSTQAEALTEETAAPEKPGPAPCNSSPRAADSTTATTERHVPVSTPSLLHSTTEAKGVYLQGAGGHQPTRTVAQQGPHQASGVITGSVSKQQQLLLDGKDEHPLHTQTRKEAAAGFVQESRPQGVGPLPSSPQKKLADAGQPHAAVQSYRLVFADEDEEEQEQAEERQRGVKASQGHGGDGKAGVHAPPVVAPPASSATAAATAAAAERSTHHMPAPSLAPPAAPSAAGSAGLQRRATSAAGTGSSGTTSSSKPALYLVNPRRRLSGRPGR